MSQQRCGRYDTADSLKTDEDSEADGEAALEEGGDDPARVAQALGVVARALSLQFAVAVAFWCISSLLAPRNATPNCQPELTNKRVSTVVGIGSNSSKVTSLIGGFVSFEMFVPKRGSRCGLTGWPSTIRGM